ncbi:GNAT family N-acetyltransferase [Paucibacter sp. DJ2R-2]|uniref:GNAT family N-acetyltransferase n=1 Tax=Paucibacter sp. DJ2R-2 TaxID=2893558 RepID=UPI0021E4C711|nr:GNAT family N-acetyltransferase [Paucibacter sp. DJ2R-2]MCV2419625.1 GNAT family N-acetyltransferase [Paucibacter sp. DJ4R-1]MCV2437471.1 GNAT family N-acetyltransferase [Paucibacter sp. DJ2R-2]
MKTLHTERLNIRPLRLADAGFMLRLLNEPSWLRFIGDRGVHTLEDAERYLQQGALENYARLGFGFCALDLRSSGVTVGMCGLTQRDYLDSPDIGFAFLPEHAGQGLAFEAASAVMQDAREALGLRRILATTRLDNQASQKLLLKLGLQFERIIRSPDGSRDLQLYAWQASGS